VTDEDAGGAPDDAFAVEERRLRQALYGPQASSRDVERYQHHLVSEHNAGLATIADAPLRRAAAGRARAANRYMRPALLAGAAVVVLVACLWIWGVGTGRAPATVTGEHPQPTSAGGGAPSTSRSMNATPTAHDGGTREFATGPASGTQTGAIRYTIASGDTELGIAARFHVCTSDVTGGLPLAMQGDYLKPGTTIAIKLDSTSIWPDNTVHCSAS
jgi:hypothetical protein